jgi:predicted DNA-binding transcriptional regulator AlpA
MTQELTTLDTAGASRYTGLSQSTLEKRRLYGGGPPFLKLGRLVRYRISDLDRWLDSQLMATTSAKIGGC